MENKSEMVLARGVSMPPEEFIEILKGAPTVNVSEAKAENIKPCSVSKESFCDQC